MLLVGQWLNPAPGLPKNPTREQLIKAGFLNRNIPYGNGNGPQIEHLRVCARAGLVHAFEAVGGGTSTIIYTKPSDKNGGVLNFKVPDSGTT